MDVVPFRISLNNAGFLANCPATASWMPLKSWADWFAPERSLSACPANSTKFLTRPIPKAIIDWRPGPDNKAPNPTSKPLPSLEPIESPSPSAASATPPKTPPTIPAPALRVGAITTLPTAAAALVASFNVWINDPFRVSFKASILLLESPAEFPATSNALSYKLNPLPKSVRVAFKMLIW